MHELLEKAVRTAKDKGKYPELSDIMKDFNTGINGTRFTSEAKKEQFERLGKQALESYYPHFIQIPVERIEDIELNFYGVEVDGNLITGQIDRIEKNNDGTYSLYDYKTGVPVPAGQVAVGGYKEGYYNQLCFYKYAYEKLSGKQVSQVGIIYIEEHQRSVYKNFDSSDMEYIENLIKETYKNIKALNFDPIPEDENGPCKFCAYKQLCRLDVL
jgi:CRISPR/Cas system-associated exonuclease Cas4 (RecB family)